MRKVGEVAIIINDKFALIKALEPLILGSEVTVYGEIKLGDNANGIQNNMIIPKGKLKIMLLQDVNVYLASVITQKISQDTPENQSIAKSLQLYSSMLSTSQEANLEGEMASYTAKLDASKAIDIAATTLVVPGDSIAF